MGHFWKPIAAAALFAGLALPATATEPQRPNIVLMLVDDAAFSDLAPYGGEAEMPAVTRLAAEGTLFTNHHTSPLCSPSRAMLLTGLDNHLTGVSTIPEILPPEQAGKKGYSLHFEDGIETVATRLNRAGYRTYMTGKWHLGGGADHLPSAHGFDRSFILEASGADNWEDKAYIPYYDRAPWYEDGEPASLPEGFYSSDFIVDKMIEYVRTDAAQEKPFFAYLAFQAVHTPVQAPAELTAKYEDRFRDGWEAMRQARWQRAQELGLISEGAALPDTHPDLRAWDDLSDAERAFFAKSMAVYAGMLEAMDSAIGRLVAHLEETGQLDNTVIVLTSDNGPEPTYPLSDPTFRLWMSMEGYTADVETLGEKGSWVAIGPEWANAASTPGRLFKFYMSEGGIRVPLIVSGPGVPAGEKRHGLSFVTDVTPTLLEMAGISPDAALTGRSLTPALAGSGAVYRPEDAVGMEVSGNAALFKGPYKLLLDAKPWGSGEWMLFDIEADPGETQDLKAAMPARYEAMRADYDAYAQRVGVQPMPAGYRIADQLDTNVKDKMVGRFLPWFAAIVAMLIAVPVGLGLAGRWYLGRRL